MSTETVKEIETHQDTTLNGENPETMGNRRDPEESKTNSLGMSPSTTSTAYSTDIIEIERYLSDMLSGLQKQQESQRTEVLQMILQQHQDLHGSGQVMDNVNGLPKQPPITFNGIPAPVSATSSAWTFTQGLILGQVSVIMLVVVFIKFFVFTEAVPTQAHKIPTKKDKSVIKTNKKDDLDLTRLKPAPMSRLATDSTEMATSNLDNLNHLNEINKALGSGRLRPNYDSTLNSILEKTYYDVKMHKPESLDWFNVLVAQIIAQARLEALIDGNIYESLDKALNSPVVLQYFDAIKITEINIGDDYPIFSNCRIQNNEGRLEAKIDVDVSDTITLGVDTNLIINQPKFMSASLPIKLAISVVRFSACLTVSLIATDDDNYDLDGNDNGNANHKMNNKSESTHNSSNVNVKKTNNTPASDIGASTANESGNDATTGNTNSREDGESKERGNSIALMFSFSPDFRLEFEIKSLIGSRAKLENIPRISSILENVIRKWFIERCIEPRFQLIKLPSLWPRKKNTRQSKSAEGYEL